MSEPTQVIEHAVVEQLQKVIDPETGADVWRMRLVENLVVDENGHTSYRFCPSSPLCPIAIPLGANDQGCGKPGAGSGWPDYRSGGLRPGSALDSTSES